MTAFEWWLVAAAIVAAASAVFHIVGNPPRLPGLANALCSAAVGVLALAFCVGLP